MQMRSSFKNLVEEDSTSYKISLLHVRSLYPPLVQLAMAECRHSLLIYKVQLLIPCSGPLSFCQLRLRQDPQGWDFYLRRQDCLHAILEKHVGYFFAKLCSISYVTISPRSLLQLGEESARIGYFEEHIEREANIGMFGMLTEIIDQSFYCRHYYYFFI